MLKTYVVQKRNKLSYIHSFVYDKISNIIKSFEKPRIFPTNVPYDGRFLHPENRPEISKIIIPRKFKFQQAKIKSAIQSILYHPHECLFK